MTTRRHEMRCRIEACVLTLLVALATVVAAQDGTGPRERRARARATTAFGKLPLYFVENQGVYDAAVRYYIQGRDKTLYFTDRGVTFSLRGEQRAWTTKLDFVGANPDARPEGRDKQPTVFSYFKGPEKDWKAGLPSFASIVYRDLWPGIDLVYNGTVNRLKYEFVVAPGADPKKIRLRYRGVETLERTDAGALKVTTPGGSFEDAPPVAWQEIDGERVPVAMAYAVGEGGAFGFEVGEYDVTKPLVLDPAVIVYCGYIGGSGDEGGGGLAIDGAGSLYVTGTTSNPQTFPVRVGPDLTYNGGWDDAFVAKVKSDGTGLVYCGYIGGSQFDYGMDIAVDAAGNAYVTGDTGSTETSPVTFPVKVGPDLTFNGGGSDAFLAKVNAQGTGLVYCGYIGGSGGDAASGVAVDAAGNAYIAGSTDSTEVTFPVSVGPDLTHNGGQDGFVANVNAQGTGFVYCGYIGGSSSVENCFDIAVDTSGNVYVTGGTQSTEATFPTKVGPDLTYNGGFLDAFVAKVNAQGTGLVYCGYIGGSGGENGSSIAVDAAGNAYVTGGTRSTEASFPVRVGPDLTHNGGADAFVARIALTLLEANGTPRPGGTVNFTLTATDDVGLAYLLGSSLGTGPIPIGGRALGLSPDPLLVATVNNYLPATFVNYTGLIAANGTAAAKINIPNWSFLVGYRIHTAFVTLQPSAPQGVKSISNTHSFQVTP